MFVNHYGCTMCNCLFICLQRLSNKLLFSDYDFLFNALHKVMLGIYYYTPRNELQRV